MAAGAKPTAVVAEPTAVVTNKLNFVQHKKNQAAEPTSSAALRCLQLPASRSSLTAQGMFTSLKPLNWASNPPLAPPSRPSRPWPRGYTRQPTR
jgi:hypothetical protein